MSLKSRARHLQLATTWPYQRCLQEIHRLGVDSATLAGKFRWPLKRADVYLINPDLDPEYREARSRGRYVQELSCENCEATFFRSLDKKGYSEDPETFCPSCIEDADGLSHCPRCGREMLEEPDGPCEDCWGDIMSKD